MSQPVWKFIQNLGDASPLEYGGLFVYIDETGVYAPECTVIECDDAAANEIQSCGDCEDDSAPCERHKSLVCWREYRVTLDRCTLTANEDGTYFLSDNQFHPLQAAWFATPEEYRATRPQDTTYLSNVVDYAGFESIDELRSAFCSEDPLERAQAYRAVWDYHGIENFDSYPLEWRAEQYNEVHARFADECKRANLPARTED